MSTYSGRRAPNVAQYLRELNAIPAQEPAPAGAEEPFALDDDLVMFTNTQFFDFETGQNTDYQSQPAKQDTENTRSENPTPATSTTMEEFNLDFTMSGEFNFPDFGAAYTSPTLHNFPENVNNLQPIQPNTQSVYPVPPQQQNSYSHPQPPRISTDKGRSPESSVSSSRPLSFEEASRLAAEEDKRRRNTAASARFRIKKKQREQALEKSAKEMNEKVTSLEGRIAQLETENKWLKNLIMEKNDGNEDIAKLWKDFSTRQQSGAGGDAGKDAVQKPPATSAEELEGGEMTG